MNWIWWTVIGVVGLFLLLFVMGLLGKADRKKGVQIENIRAQLMLLSTDAKEIEAFLMLKEPYITQELINLLIARVAELKVSPVQLPGSNNEKQ